MFHYRYIWMLLSLCLFAGCSPHDLHEAQRVVAEADSLWQQGQMYDDSTQLAQAYNTLHAWRAFYTDEYAHACYHYGKLLRAKEDPVSAMQVFINATHSRTHDYHIFGRVYSNMGDMCRLAGFFYLAYDMFDCAAENFLENSDTISYCYAKNSAAFELASAGLLDSCNDIVNEILDYNKCDGKFMAYCYLSKAEAYLRIGQFESAINNSYISKNFYPNIDAVDIQLAQAYSALGIKDSAVYYANYVLSHSKSLFLVNNAQYILTNDDNSRDINAVRDVAADRADTQKLIEIRQGKLSQAVQLLEQDLSRKPDLRWLYAVCLTLTIIGVALGLYVRRKHRQHTLLSQQIYELEVKSNETIAQKRLQVASNCALYSNSNNLRKDLCWNDYDKMCHIVDQQFYMLASKLRHKNVLNEKELRLCILVLLDMSRQEISDILPYALSSVGKLKDQTAKSLGSTGKNLHDYLLNLVIEG